MKEIKLDSLKLQNFKGIKKLDLDMQGGDLKVYGDNATGKTSIFDGFLWLLFNKDSNNRADFAIKTLDGGEELHNLDHLVEAAFTIDGQPLRLGKVYRERWTKKRGMPIPEFTGHETDHQIDGVPLKKKEYEEKVGTIVKEDVFKLLTNPLYFNESLKWQDRRKTLLEVVGEIDFEDVLAFNQALKDLPAILQGREIDDHRKVIAARRTEINEELKRIPVRIDELMNTLPETTEDVAAVQSEVEALEKQLDELTVQISNIRNGSAITAKQNDLRQLEMDLEAIKRELEADATDQGYKVKARIQEEQSNMAIIQRKKVDAEQQVESLKKDTVRLQEKMTELRDKWHEIDERVFEHNQECECPTCGQSLPEEQLQNARETAEKSFNLKKSSDLETVNSTGLAYKTEEADLLDRIEKLEKGLPTFASDIEAKEKIIQKLNSELVQLRESIKDARQDPKYTDKQQEIQKVNEDIEALKSSADEAVRAIESEVAELKGKRSELNGLIAKQEQSVASKKRIAELEEQQEELAAEYEKLERELFLTEEYIRSKVELLESKINSKFKYARFKLFKQNINGGLEEMCETTFEGVPYSSGLNNAAKINVGIDIINTLSEHFGIRAPIFIDNAEAVTKIADTDSQLISLVVSESDKQLRIETHEQTMKEAI